MNGLADGRTKFSVPRYRSGLPYIAIKIYANMRWTVEFLDDGVQAVLTGMPRDIQASFRRIVELI
jgi:hypothetical protein